MPDKVDADTKLQINICTVITVNRTGKGGKTDGFPSLSNLTGFFQGFYIPYEDGAVAQFNDALPSQLVQNAAHGHSAGRYRGGDVLLCTADRAAGGGE